MDTGPVLLQRPTAIGPEETAAELAGRLAALGADVLLETLARLDTLVPRPQDSACGDPGAAAPQGGRRAGLDGAGRDPRGARPGTQSRGPGPPPRAPGGRLAIWRARAIAGRGEPGVVTRAEGRLAIGTGAGLLEPLEVQPENRRAMDWDAYLRGARLGPGAPLGATVPRA